jgi:hypothetical protein
MNSSLHLSHVTVIGMTADIREPEPREAPREAPRRGRDAFTRRIDCAPSPRRVEAAPASRPDEAGDGRVPGEGV